ncbi:MAG: hypothetical protein ACJ71E_13060 [Nitrososphaeraceae archaeon]
MNNHHFIKWGQWLLRPGMKNDKFGEAICGKLYLKEITFIISK